MECFPPFLTFSKYRSETNQFYLKNCSKTIQAGLHLYHRERICFHQLIAATRRRRKITKPPSLGRAPFNQVSNFGRAPFNQVGNKGARPFQSSRQQGRARTSDQAVTMAKIQKVQKKRPKYTVIFSSWCSVAPCFFLIFLVWKFWILFPLCPLNKSFPITLPHWLTPLFSLPPLAGKNARILMTRVPSPPPPPPPATWIY